MEKTLLLAFLLSTSTGLMANCGNNENCVMCCGNYPTKLEEKTVKDPRGNDNITFISTVWSGGSASGCGNYGPSPTCSGNQPYKVTTRREKSCKIEKLSDNAFEIYPCR